MNKKSFVTTELLCLFLGLFGIHRFYTGYVGIGILQLLTGGGFGLWALIDLIMISLNKYVDSDGEELEDYNSKFGITILILTSLIILKFLFFPAKEQKAKSKNKIEQNIVLKDLDNIDYSFKKLPSNISNFLENSKEYRTYYTNGKNIVIYFTGADCPYASAFESKISKIENNYEFDNFQFYPAKASGMKRFKNMDEAKADVEFSNLCQEFCIVNPKKNELFRINGIGNQEISKIDEILLQLKDW